MKKKTQDYFQIGGTLKGQHQEYEIKGVYDDIIVAVGLSGKQNVVLIIDKDGEVYDPADKEYYMSYKAPSVCIYRYWYTYPGNVIPQQYIGMKFLAASQINIMFGAGAEIIAVESIPCNGEGAAAGIEMLRKVNAF